MNKKILSVLIGGTFFGFGLAYSGAAIPEVVLSFLELKDLGLALILIVAIIITSLTYNIVPRIFKKPFFGKSFAVRKLNLSKNTFIGATIFGIGWGLSGLCPGTVLSGIGMGNFPLIIGALSMFAGAYFNGRINSSQ